MTGQGVQSHRCSWIWEEVYTKLVSFIIILLRFLRCGQTPMRCSDTVHTLSLPCCCWPPQRIYPDHGPMNGGTAVTLFGRGFSTSVSCRFNNQLVVSALFMTSHMISCVSPEATETGETLIDIGSDFTSPQVRPSKSAARVAVRSFSVASVAQVPAGSAAYTYLKDIQIFSVVPAAGPVDGGSFVHLLGDGFDARSAEQGYMICRFNSSVSVAIYISHMEAACYSPEMPAGEVRLELSNNHQDFSGSGIVFTYMHMSLTEVLPAHGPAHGGTALEIHGQGLAITKDVSCVFSFDDEVRPNCSRHDLPMISP